MAKKKVSDDKTLNKESKSSKGFAEKKVLLKNELQINLKPDNLIQVMQELQTHQIELEMQNEELKQSHLDLEESRKKYSDLYDFAPVGYITLNGKGVITMSNITSNQLLGIERLILANTPFTNYIFKEDQDVYYLNRKRLLETGEKQQFELRLVKKDNSVFWANVDAALSENNEGDVLITLTDISNRKIVEADKQNILAFSESTLESINNGILAVANNGNVLKTNRVFAEMWNVPDNIINSKRHNELLNYVLEQLEDPVEFKERVTNLYTNPEKESFDLIHFKDGRIFERISKPMYIDGNAIGRVWSFLDITDRKNAEEVIRLKNNQLEKTNAEKDKFFSIIAHDLRSPFNVFLGFTEILKEDLHGMSIKELQTIAERLNRSAKNLFELLTNLLEWSMIQRNDYAFHPVKLSIDKIIKDCADLYSEAANKKKIRLITGTDDNIIINADESMMKTILRNLISNSIKFTNEGGKVDVSAKKSGGYAAISVNDNGIGMPDSIIKGLFKIDVRTNRKGTADEPSTGLGLLLCKEFIEKHKGELHITSEEGKGTGITVTLPLN